MRIKIKYNFVTKTKQKYFTLTELLIVIAILAILMSLMQPALLNAMYRAKLTSCATNQKNLHVLLMMYADDNYDLYPKNTNCRSSLPHLGTNTNNNIRELIKPYCDSLENTFRCAGTSDLFKGNNLDDAGQNASMPTDYYMYFSVRDVASNGQAKIGMDKSSGYKTEKASLQMLRVGDTWTPNFTGHYLDTEGPQFDFIANDIKIAGGYNHIAPSFEPYTTDFWQTKGFWLGGIGDSNHLFQDGSVVLLEAMHGKELFKTWYHGSSTQLPKEWNLGMRAY
jgi:prepilin-type N-terminal cleavage/methylation domain-containing protein